MAQLKYIRLFNELGIDDVPLVGGKNASLGEMYRNLSETGVKVPNGFAITADAYRYFLEANGLTARITEAIAALDVHDVTQLAATGSRIRGWLREATLPADLAEEIRLAYANLAAEYGPEPDVAVRSSATAEDLPDASFAGQQETYLNVRGLDALLERTRHVFASLFTDRAISYREDKGFDHMSVALSVGVQKMVRSDLACSGVMFTLDTESGFRDVVFITGAYGLGENVVQGAVNPDEYYVFKPTLAQGFRPIVKRQRGEKAIRMVYAEPGGPHPVENLPVAEAERHRFVLTDDEVRRVEEIVNAEIIDNAATQARVMPIDDAQKLGAMMLFGEKYGDVVRVLDIGTSRELCGGTHVARTGDIGFFKVVGDGGVAAGIRRIEATTGRGALAFVQAQEAKLAAAAAALKAPVGELEAKIAQLMESARAAEKELAKLKAKAAASAGDDLAGTAIDVKGAKVLAAAVDGADAKALRETMDKLKDKLKSAAIVLGSVADGKVTLIAGVTSDLTAKVKAGELVNHVAQQVGGKGGGRPDMAQAGGTDPAGLPAALRSVHAFVEQRL